MLRRFVVVLLVCPVAMVLAGVSLAGAPSRTNAGAVTNVTVHMGDYYFQLSTSSVPAGTVVFTLINDGMTDHDFSIAGATSPTIAPKATARMTVSFSAAGQYSYSCTIPGHASNGMVGALTVRGGTPTAALKVTEQEWKIALKNAAGKTVKSVKHGLIRFKVTNLGAHSHNFVIAGRRTILLARGKSATLTVSLKRGKYRYSCSVAGHAAAGMKGTLFVT
ncbi:MAG: plastocyanin/azurin family copper-binding protein [Actinomycetota bacterium]|nr:plastocyanin/azurin family copper-binding protein [Actinomycetota bacterium]